MRLTNLKRTTLILVLLTTIGAMGQDIHHAPTAEQCKADEAVWNAESKADIAALPVNTLLQRSNYLSACYKVLQNVNFNSAVWALSWQGIYDAYAIRRALNFIDRHGLRHQFDEEDAKGAR
jgi:hypothetical protein